jgi:hypothetical protein
VKVAAVLLGLLCLAVSGCGPNISHLPKTVKAEGTVTLDGQPVPGATLTFIAEQGNYHASAVTVADGTFKLNAFKEKTGAVPGKYHVEINKTVAKAGEGGESGLVNVQYGLPKKYASMGTSGLTHTIPDKDTTDIKFELSSK